MTTKFRQKLVKIALMSVLCKKSRNFSRVFGVRELKYAIRIFKETKAVAMITKIKQKYAEVAHSSVQDLETSFACTISDF